MGTINKGILGGFSGTVGSVVGGTWKGISYMRSKAGPRKTASSAAQLAQQARFRLMVKFLQPLAGLLAVSYRDAAVNMSGFNIAVKNNLDGAVSGAYPDFTVDPSLVTISRGSLPGAQTPAAASTVAGQIAFSWKDNSGTGRAAATDQAVLLAYSQNTGQAVYATAAAPRSAQAAVLAVPGFSGLKADTYLAFMAANGRVSNSVYTGAVTIL